MICHPITGIRHLAAGIRHLITGIRHLVTGNRPTVIKASPIASIRIRCIVAAFLGATLHASALAQDRVWLEPSPPSKEESGWYPGAIQVIEGEIQQFDATGLKILKVGQDRPISVRATRVIWVQPGKTIAGEQEAIELFLGRKYGESLMKLPEILSARPPIWRQQWITMMASVSAWKSGRSKIALELVGQLDRRPLPPLVIAWLPLAWRNGRPSADAIEAALARLDDSSAAVRLVAASWLLSTPHRSQAADVLKRLSDDDRPEISKLAGVQLWRMATPPEVIDHADQWERTLNSLPLVWQTGPAVTLTDRLRAAGLKAHARRLEMAQELVPIHPHPATEPNAHTSVGQ